MKRFVRNFEDAWIARLNRGERRAITITIAAIIAIGVAGGVVLAWLGRIS